MEILERAARLMFQWGTRFVVGLALLAGASVAYTQDAPADTPPATEQAAPGAEGRLAAGTTAATPEALAPAPQGTPPPLATVPPSIPLSGTCSSAYGVYADPSGRYP